MSLRYYQTICFTLSLVIASLGSALAQQRTVTTTADSGPGSLREALTLTTSDITFAAALNGQTIALSSPIAVTQTLRINGNGAAVTMITGPSGVFVVTGGAVVDISRVGIFNSQAVSGAAINATNSTVRVFDCTFTNNVATGNASFQGGGAIYSTGGMLIVQDSRFFSNRATGSSGSGGAVFNGDGGMVRLTRSIFKLNTASRAGGAFEDQSGATTRPVVFNCNFVQNTASPAPGNGGAIHITGSGSMDIFGGTSVLNVASSEGGSFWNGTGEMAVGDVVFINNTANGNASDQGGGAIYSLGGRLLVTGATSFKANKAPGLAGSGGAILADVGTKLEVYNAYFEGNQAVRAGGAIEDRSGSTTTALIGAVTFVNNIAGASPGNGGAYHVTGDGDVEFHAGEVRGNAATTEGGGLWNGTGSMLIKNTLIFGNIARGDNSTQGGGGIFNNGGTVTIKDGAVISRNRAGGAAGSGGGILNAVGGTLTINNATIDRNSAARAGGGIEDQAGAGRTMTLDNVTMDGNFAASNPGSGGAIHITGASDAQINASSFTNNYAAKQGGALWNGSGTMEVSASTISANLAFGRAATDGGGGAYNRGGTLIFNEGTTITDNRTPVGSGSGGGIFNADGGTLEIDDVTFDGNMAQRAGGGIEDASNGSMMFTNATFTDNRAMANPGNGGGVHITGSATTTVDDTEFTDNYAASEGGGFWNGSGTATFTNTSFEGNEAAGAASDNGGGAVYNLSGVVNVTDGYFADNTATGASGSGGAFLFDEGSNGTITNSTLERNSASRAGGAIETKNGFSGLVAVNNSILQDNETGSAPGNGGAVHITGPGNMNFTGSQILGNYAANEGGGLWNGSGAMNITQSIVRDNVADGADGGGGVYNEGGTVTVSRSLIADNDATAGTAIGGGIHNANPGTVNVRFSTISGNSSAFNAGGIANAGTLSVTAATIALNTAANRGGGIGQAMGATTATLRSTIVGLNSAPTQGANLDAAAGSYVSAGFNLIESDDANVFPAASTDKEGTMAMPVVLNLQPLADNGGPTPTHALTCGSDAINMGDPTLGDVDQRGRAPFGVRDIGAFELETACPAFAPTSPTTSFASTFSVYPTQTRNNVTIEVAEEFGITTQGEDSYTFRLVDASGLLIREVKTSSDRIKLDAYGLTPGSYFVQRITEAGVESHTFQVLD